MVWRCRKQKPLSGLRVQQSTNLESKGDSSFGEIESSLKKVAIFFKILTFSSICLFCEFVWKGSSNSNVVCIESKYYFHSISPVARLYQPQAVGFSACLDRLIVCDTILFLWAIYMIRCYGTVDGLCVVSRDFMLTEEKDQTNGV